jgi:hypothetical protein
MIDQGDDITGHRLEVIAIGEARLAVAAEVHRHDPMVVTEAIGYGRPAVTVFGDAMHEECRWAAAAVIGKRDLSSISNSQRGHGPELATPGANELREQQSAERPERSEAAIAS